MEVRILGGKPPRKVLLQNVLEKDGAHRPMITGKILAELRFQDASEQSVTGNFRDQRGGGVRAGLAVPGSQNAERSLRLGTFRRVLRSRREELFGQPFVFERTDIGLNPQHIRRIEGTSLAEELKYPRGAVRSLPVRRDEKRVAVRNDAPVCRGDHPAGWIVGVGKIFKGNEARPVVVVGAARDGDGAIALLADRDQPRCVIPDIPFLIRIHEILHGHGEIPQGRGELLPVAGLIHAEEGKADGVRFERRPAQGEVAIAVVGNHRPVACDLDRERVVALVPDLDDLVANFRVNPLAVMQVLGGIPEVEVLGVEVLDVGSCVRHAPGDMFVVANDHQR